MTSIIKCTRNREYAKISNKLLQNNKLSLKARGLMAYILSLPDTWDICVEHLHGAASDHDGRTAVSGAMKELREFGYLHLERLSTGGKMTGSRWLAYDDPSENPNLSTSGFPDKQVSRLSGNPSDGKPTTIKETPERNEKQKIKDIVLPALPIELNSPEMAETWNQWIEFRKSIRARITPISANRAFKDFSKWGQSAAIESINESIRNGWRGVFAPKTAPSYMKQEPKIRIGL